MRPVSITSIGTLLAIICVAAAVISVAACGGSGDVEPSPAPTPAEPAAPEPTEAPATAPTEPAEPEPTEAPAPTPMEPATEPTEAPAPTPTEPAPEPTEAATPTEPAPEDQDGPREIGEYEGVTFIVSEGSEATFTVEEQLTRLPLPNDAVMRTTALSGEVHLDGRPSELQIDLHQLSSDQVWRDRYVRERMFPTSPIATFTVAGDQQAPEGLARGEEVTAQVAGSLEIRDVTVPLVFDVEARDDGKALFLVGRTVFTWDQLDISPPTASVVTSIEDEVRVEVLLALVPN